MAILVIAEHDNQSLKAATLNTVTAPARSAATFTCWWPAAGCAAAAEAAAKVAGVAKVLVADAAHYADQTAENLPRWWSPWPRLQPHARPGHHRRQELLPRVAALLDVAQISEIVAVESADTFVRPIYAGNALATVQSPMPSRSSPCAPRVSKR
jgi:electron transfer flavoprotein alpha subunit